MSGAVPIHGLDPATEARLSLLRDWLAVTRVEAAALPLEPPVIPGSSVGFGRLVEEFSALRQDVKSQTRSGRQMQEQIEGLLSGLGLAIQGFEGGKPELMNAKAALRAAIDRLDAIAQAKPPEPPARGLADALADLDDSLERAALEIDRMLRMPPPPPAPSVAEPVRQLEEAFRKLPWWRKAASAEHHLRARTILEKVALATPVVTHDYEAMLFAFAEGFDLLRARLRRAMDREEIFPIDASPGSIVDPNLMRVVEAVLDPKRKSGTVIQEIRRGYIWRGRVLRVAEVRAIRNEE